MRIKIIACIISVAMSSLGTVGVPEISMETYAVKCPVFLQFLCGR